MLGISILGISMAEPVEEPNDTVDAVSRLDFFLPNEQTRKSIGGHIDELDSDSFARRDAASKKLSNLPTLPGFVRQLAKEEKRPEVRARIKDLIRLFPIERENSELNDILKQINAHKTKGALGKLSSIMGMEIWSPEKQGLKQAASTTVTPEDLPLIVDNLNSKSVRVRCLMAAALGGLPRNASSHLLNQLLK